MAYARLTDAEWERVSYHFANDKRWTGRPRRDARAILDALLFVLESGCAWGHLPRNGYFPPYTTVWRRFGEWKRNGTLKRVLRDLKKQCPPSSVYYLDSTVREAKKGGSHWPKHSGSRQ